ncbi:MAG: hypothetical protein A2048_09140 [Deltaproteobacteria bacterium GWA2_45_12]|nr:MAG: hypothetical protein A2048_09140 [Deltaproteobacteria bacterium GWA2_45_12]
MPRMATPFLRPVRAPRGLRPLPPSPLPLRMAAPQSGRSSYSSALPIGTNLENVRVKPNIFGAVPEYLSAMMGPKNEDKLRPVTGFSFEECYGRLARGPYDENDFDIYDLRKRLLDEVKRTPFPTKEQKRQLIKLCKLFFDKDDNFFQARKILEPLHDYSGLRRLVELYMQRYPLNRYSYDAPVVLMALEEYEKVLAVYKKREDFVFDLLDSSDELVAASDCGFERYVAGYGDKTPPAQSLWEAPRLFAISKEYDICIAIAKGGLYSGFIAQTLGIPTLIVEIHAHGRSKPVSHWVTPVALGDIQGKRVLLLDKDAVTGASIAEAVRLLLPYNPQRIGVYFNHSPWLDPDMGISILQPETVDRIEGLGVKIHHPQNTPSHIPNTLFFELHERFGTNLGRLLKVDRRFKDILPEAQRNSPDLASVLKKKWEALIELWNSFNPLLPGVFELRARLLTHLEGVLRSFQSGQEIARRMGDLLKVNPYESLLNSLSSPSSFLVLYAEELAVGRYRDRGLTLAKKRDVENTRLPHSYLASFCVAERAVREGNYDVALIVGPEGFAFEPIFEDLGLPTVAVNIPEDDYGGKRSLQAFDDLSSLKGKRVLVVEDDLQSGATVVKLLAALPKEVAGLDLYLGNGSGFQRLENVPSGIQKIYVSNGATQPEEDGEIFLRHLAEREMIFKEEKLPDWF